MSAAGDERPVANQMDVAATQVPCTHAWLVAHAVPQAPQLTGSVWVTTQALPQAVQPGEHTAVHVPAAHVAAAFVTSAHRLPHAPQLSPSVSVFTHAPLQEVKPGKQDGGPHVPDAVQVGKPPLGVLQLELPESGQLPQASGDCVRSTQLPEHSLSGGEQAETHPLGAHRLVAPAHVSSADVHVVGLDRSVSHPFAATPSVSTQPGWHVAIAQLPAVPHADSA